MNPHVFIARCLLVTTSLISLPAWSNSSEIYDSETGAAEVFDLSQARPLDRIIATINDDIILQSQLSARLQQTEQEMLSRNMRLPDSATLQQKVLDAMILEEVQLQRAKQLGLNIADEDLLPKLEEVAKTNRLTLPQLRNRLNQMEANGFETFRETLRQKLLIQELRETEVVAKTQVTKEEIDNYLQRKSLKLENREYHLGHIMLSLPDSATPQQRTEIEQKAQHLRQMLTEGADFAQTAVRHSNGSQALNGGDLGWLSHDQIPTFFTQALSQLKPNQISEVIASPVGYHLIKLHGMQNKAQAKVTQYQLHRFLLLSDDVQPNMQPPASIQRLTNAIRSLDDFTALQADYRDMPAEVNKQTDLGWIELSSLPAELAQLLSQMPPKTAMALATEEGWAILYLDAIRQAAPETSSERQQALQTLRLQKANETFDVWLRRLKEEAIIHLYLTQKGA